MRHAGRLSTWSQLLLLDAILAAGKLWALDCNQNGIPDEEDLEPIFKLDAPTELAASLVPQDEELRKSAIGRPEVDVGISIQIDRDHCGSVADPVFLLGFLFLRGPPPPEPGLPGSPCGVDPEKGGLEDGLSCELYMKC